METFRTLARFARHGAIEEATGLTLIATGVPIPSFNPAALAARLRQFYARAGMPGELLAVGLEEGRDAGMLAAAAGLVPDGTSRGMLLFPLADEPPLPAGLAIRVVRDAATLRRYNDT